MGKQLNYNLARMYCVALVMGKLHNQRGALVLIYVSSISVLLVLLSFINF